MILQKAMRQECVPMNENYVRVFEELQPDFFRYMLEEGHIARKTSRDYIWRLRFLSQHYLIDESMSEDRIEKILAEEDVRRVGRETYSTRKAISDFRGGLRKFLSFAKSDYIKRKQDSIISQIKEVECTKTITETERTAVLQARVGQGKFRRQLVNYWHGCSVSRCDVTWMLVASHIKPWRVADNVERLDVYNGLLLLPNYDKLFDLGYMSFTPSGKVVYSRLLDGNDKRVLNLSDDLCLSRVEARHKRYLKYHNENCLL